MKKTIVAIYGTLKKGKYNYPLITRDKNNEFICNDSVDGFIILVETRRNVPYALPLKDSKIKVELYSLSPKTFKQVDGLERAYGYKSIKVKTDSGKECLIYVPKYFELTNDY